MSILLTKKDVSIASLFEDCHQPDLRFFMQKGISTYLFADEKLTINHLKSLQSSGFKRLEIFALKPHFDYHQKKEVSALAAWLIDQGSFLHSIHTPFCLDYQARGYLEWLSIGETEKGTGDFRTVQEM